MPLFTMPTTQEREFNLTSDMKIVVDSGKLPEEQVRKFADFPELLDEELNNEDRCPSIESIEKDIFDAVYVNDYHKFFRCVAKTGVDETLLPRIYNWLVNKPDFGKKDMQLLRRLEGARSVFNIFEY